jgi:hypothetical protein
MVFAIFISRPVFCQGGFLFALSLSTGDVYGAVPNLFVVRWTHHEQMPAIGISLICGLGFSFL